MVQLRWLLVLLAVAPFAGCENTAEEEAPVEEDGAEDMTIVVEADKSRILEEEKQLTAKRDEMRSERERLEKERLELGEKLASLSKKDKKARESLEAEQARVESQEKALRDRVKNFEDEREKLTSQKNQLLERIATLTAKKGGLTTEQREELIARREKDLASREAQLAERERKVAERERQAGQTLASLGGVLEELKAGGMGKTVIVNQAAPAATPAAGASKASVEKSRKALRSKMDAKGILLEDLPPTARSLNSNAASALNNKEFDSAMESLGQLEQMIDSLVINRDFVQAKFQRLAKEASAKKLDGEMQKKVQGLLNEVSESFNDGRYDKANRKANQIAAILSDQG